MLSEKYLRCCRPLVLTALVAALVAGAAPVVADDCSTIYDIQFTLDPTGTSPCVDEVVTLTAVVTAASQYGFFMAEAPGPWQGIFVYTWLLAPEVGDRVEVVGIVEEYYGLTEVYAFAVTVVGTDPVEAMVVDPGQAGQEAYESTLVRVEDVTVLALFDYGEWAVGNSGGNLLCDDAIDYLYFPKVGDTLDSLTGIVAFDYGSFKLEPRFTNDVVGDVIPHYALKGSIVTMNDAREVLHKGYVEILGDEIVSVGRERPKDVQVVNTQGLVFPGLIDAHNHAQYNVLGTIPFGRTFADRYEWRVDPVYGEFNDQWRDIRDFVGPYFQTPNIVKLAEVQALAAGTTMMQGIGSDSSSHDLFAHLGVGTGNAGRYPSWSFSSTFPFWEEPWLWAYLKDQGYFKSFVVHLSEGINSDSLAEFWDWQGAGMLDGRTTVIHGVPYGDPEWAAMGSVGASLVWSPTSNLTLYGATADVPGALAAGVNVALAPDWTPSGSLNVLEEMKAAARFDHDNWGHGLTPLVLTEMVTRNAASALGLEHRIGRIAPGYQADLMVIEGSHRFPYDSLLQASQGDVNLTVVAGRPKYGEPQLMRKFAFDVPPEELVVEGETKLLALAIDSHSIPYADWTFAQVEEMLGFAYDASDPKVCTEVGIGRW